MKFRKRLDKILGHTLVFIMAVMVVNVLWQVISRYGLGTPSSFTDELARFLMIWIGVLGAAYVAGHNGHVAIDVLARRGSDDGQKRLKQFVRMTIILFCLFAMVVGGFVWFMSHTFLSNIPPHLEYPWRWCI